MTPSPPPRPALVGVPIAYRASPVATPPRPLTPAAPSAVNVPVLTAGVVMTAFTLGVAWVGGTTLEVGLVLRCVALAVLQILAVVALRTLLRGRGGPRTAFYGTAALAFGALVLFDELLPAPPLPWAGRVLVWLASIVLPPLVSLWRAAWMRRRPLHVTLLAPSELAAREAILRLEEIPGLRVTNALIPGCSESSAAVLLGIPTASSIDGRLALDHRVVVSSPFRSSQVAAAIARLVALGHAITSESATLRAAEGRVDTLRADPLNLILSRHPTPLLDLTMRLRDLLLATIGLVVLAPVFVLVALAIKIDSRGPVFYRQRRVGYRGRSFPVIKFRSMVTDAERASGPVWAGVDDPRITRVGRFIRRARIDELPQLLNVVAGQMSLVGPRPERPHFFDHLRAEVPLFDLRTIVRPGITGWAQVRAPYAADTADAHTKLEYDLFYVLRRTPFFDLSILLETAGVVLSGRGAR
jgi:exopolysaccharide biosynthesis polyprenyl glycosylphosphotransferase